LGCAQGRRIRTIVVPIVAVTSKCGFARDKGVFHDVAAREVGIRVACRGRVLVVVVIAIVSIIGFGRLQGATAELQLIELRECKSSI